MVKKIKDALGGDVAGKTIGVLGLTFKPETDDLRDAPSMSILPPLYEKGAKLQVHDPEGMEEAMKICPEWNYVENAYDVCKEADAIVLMTEWNRYRALDMSKIKDMMRSPVFIDLRNVYEPEKMKDLGFKYFSAGR